ncbi:conserved hypothetical protein [Syntrophobacter fumaroxidans MPOB]|uniref:GyrI-like small molecule binding domain-containing protein n=1 Tax=Syntrophobacter fumaroxidans (strain DSM 10017 / MPOB) TaxID=335543 RepID=A0LJ12_SYNFM|nr:conserved hypothetical protein [Syntrophobacter fumaroxidans MPOB]
MEPAAGVLVTTIDFKKQHKDLYRPPAGWPVLVDVPAMVFLMADGRGDPTKTPEFARTVETLFGIAYSLKSTFKKAGTFPDFVVPPLECLWWTDDSSSFSFRDLHSWRWTLMIRQPEHVEPVMVAEARKQLMVKKKDRALPDVRLEACEEGPAVQALHVGAYCDEHRTIEKMHALMMENGWIARGKHHEIYLNDPRRTVPEKLKTILRQPISRNE